MEGSVSSILRILKEFEDRKEPIDEADFPLAVKDFLYLNEADIDGLASPEPFLSKAIALERRNRKRRLGLDY